MPDLFDVLVIGGGPAGSATAILLARAGWKVVLLERKAFPRRKVCGEYLSATNWPLLEALGVGTAFSDQAGPPVREVGLFAGETVVTSELPRPRGVSGWGRALSRERLDTLLLQQARASGALVIQPAVAQSLAARTEWFQCVARHSETGTRVELRGRIIIAAHGSWEPGGLPTQWPHRPPRAGDLFGFKAHFGATGLAEGLMPLLSYPDGYGGLVHTDGGRVSLSCCIRYHRLAELREQTDAEAGDAVLGHILRSCRGVREALEDAERDGPWLSAGPIRPGIRMHARRGIFPVGNVAGEAHPVVAEGISMALQGAALLADQLVAWKQSGGHWNELPRVQAEYAARWRRRFAARVHASAAIAHWAMRPGIVARTLPFVRRWPQLLNWGARLAGKASIDSHL